MSIGSRSTGSVVARVPFLATITWMTALGALLALIVLLLTGSLPVASIPGMLTEDPWAAGLAPVAEAASTIAAIAVVGGLLGAGLLLAEPGEALDAKARRLLSVVGGCALWWLVATMACGMLAFVRIYALPLADVINLPGVTAYLTDTTLGRTFLVQSIVALVLLIVAPMARTAGQVRILLVLALAAIAAQGFAGHSSATADHTGATILLAAHLVGVSLWVGGIVVAAAVALGWAPVAASAWQRLSAVALWSATLVAVTGVAQGWIRMGSASNLFTTDYGLLLVVKAELLAVLIACGWIQRSRALRWYATGSRRAFGILVLIEVVVMAIVIGLSVALSMTPTPLALAIDHGSHGLPPVPSSGWSLIFGGSVDAAAIVAVSAVGISYAIGAGLRRTEGRPTPTWRLASFSVAMALVIVLTCTGVGTYAKVLPGLWLIQQACWLTIVPTLMLLGQPWAHLRSALQASGIEPGRRRPVLTSGPGWSAGVVMLIAIVTFLLSLYATGAAASLLWISWVPSALGLTALVLGLGLATCVLGWDGPARAIRWGLAWAAAAVLAAVLVVLLARGEVLAGTYFGYFIPPYADDVLAEQRTGVVAALGVLLAWLACLGWAGRRCRSEQSAPAVDSAVEIPC